MKVTFELNPECADIDGDDVCDLSDNCVNDQNPLQENFDYDGLGDACDPDDDNDGVLDVGDRCQFSVLPEAVPTEGLLPNHYADIDGDGFFESVHPKYKSIIEDTVPFGTTNGCSCEEIFNLMPGNHEGEKKYGCPKGTLDMWSKRGAGGGS